VTVRGQYASVNTNYVVLGEPIAQASDMSYSDLIEERIVQPIGPEHTRASLPGGFYGLGLEMVGELHGTQVPSVGAFQDEGEIADRLRRTAMSAWGLTAHCAR
jgi:CubicO group peptidase (beta-lactamase class C family)